jgi:nicotinate-nucleotide adenylyltransferase
MAAQNVAGTRLLPLRYAILGGSFDPLHKGHFHLARAVLALGYDRIIFVPAFRSPYKTALQGDSSAVRLDMLLAAICGERAFTVDACEIKREGISYTIDTVEDIISRYVCRGKPGLILGDDLAAEFPTWKHAQAIAEKTDIIIGGRFGMGGGDAHDKKRTSHDGGEGVNPETFPFPCTMLGNALMELSSGLVRDLIRSGGAWQDLTPPAVRQIILEQGLYGSADALGNSTPDGGAWRNDSVAPNGGNAACGASQSEGGVAEQTGGARGEDAQRRGLWSEGGSPPPDICSIESFTRKFLHANRFIHSRNVALHCADLCDRFGLDADKGYLAGITHDVCKELSEEKMIALAKKDGAAFSDLEQKKIKLLHGRAAAIFIQEQFGVRDEDVIEAVRYHTMGQRDMGPLAKIVYLADKIEVARKTVDPALRQAVFGEQYSDMDLDQLFKIILNATVDYLVRGGLSVSKETMILAHEAAESAPQNKLRHESHDAQTGME